MSPFYSFLGVSCWSTTPMIVGADLPGERLSSSETTITPYFFFYFCCLVWFGKGLVFNFWYRIYLFELLWLTVSSPFVVDRFPSSLSCLFTLGFVRDLTSVIYMCLFWLCRYFPCDLILSPVNMIIPSHANNRICTACSSKMWYDMHDTFELINLQRQSS